MPNPPVYNVAPVTGAAGFRDASNNELQDWLVVIAANTKAMKDSMEHRASREEKEKDEPSWVKRLGDRFERGLGTAVGSVLGQARSLSARGMAGTLEQAQNQWAMDQLGRQFAAVMMPVTQAMTYFASQVERRMAAMGGTEQNRMMGAIIGGGVGWHVGGGPFSALAGAALGSALMGGESPRGVGLNIAAGAYAGARVAGPIGGLIGGTAAAMFSPPREEYDEKPGVFTTGGYYQRMRRPVEEGGYGANRLDATLATGGRAMLKAFSDLTPTGIAFKIAGAPLATPVGDMARAAMAGGPPPRRDVTPFTPEMKSAGDTAMKIQEGMIRATAGAGAEEEAGPFKPIIDVLLMIFDELVSIRRGLEFSAPAPRPAGPG